MKSVPRRASGSYWTYQLGGDKSTSTSPPTLDLTVDPHPEATILRIGGRLDTSLDEKLVGVVQSLISEGRVRLIVDGSGLDYLSSRGVSAFVAIVDELREKGGDIKLACLKPQCTLVLDRLGISRLIQCFETVEQAIAALETPIEDCMVDGGLETFVAGFGTKVFHTSRCAHAARLRRITPYASRKEAREAGLRPCRRCC